MTLASIGLKPSRDFTKDAKRIAGWRSGVIETRQGRFSMVCARWWPHWGSVAEAMLHRHWSGLPDDTCRLYFHESTFAPGYLTLNYVHSGNRTGLSTFYCALVVLDEIARLKRSHAIVAHRSYSKISERLLKRWGWEFHLNHLGKNHIIKRLYGNYMPPENAQPWLQPQIGNHSQAVGMKRPSEADYARQGIQ